MNILVTGSAGFIASNVIPKLLEHGHKVFGVDTREHILLSMHKNLELIKSNVFDLNWLDLMDNRIDAVIHLAFVTNIPKSIEEPLEFTKNNIVMSVHMLEIARLAMVKMFIFASTASLYNDNAIPWKEDMKPDPIEPYSAQKLTIEHYCKLYSKLYGLKTVVFRFYQVFGENQRTDTAMYKFLQAAKDNKPITLTRTTAQSSFDAAQRDFIHAGDIGLLCIEAIEHDGIGNGEIFNVASGNVHTLRQVVDALGATVEFIPRRPFEVERHEADMTKTFSTFKWRPTIDIIDWLKNFKQNIK